MEIHGGLSNREPIGNLLIAIAVVNEPEHIQLPRRQILFTQMFRELGGDLGRNVPPAAMDRADNGEQFTLGMLLRM